jgi:hypothetical protein
MKSPNHIYHLFPLGALYDKANHSYRSIREIESWIDHWKRLHIDTVLLGPVFESVSHGYDTVNWRRVDPRIGSSEDLQFLIHRLHENDIRVVLDAVWNHTSRKHFAYRDLQEKGMHSKYADWFRQIDWNKPNKCGDSFTVEGWNGFQELPQLNLNSSSVQQEIMDVASLWIESLDIDGVRLDAAQSACHLNIDVQKLDCDFLAFSGHKIYGPTGIGVLYGKSDVLESMPPWHGGGEMISQVTFEKTTYAAPPARFEAGTPPIAEVIGLGAAIEWLNQVSLSKIEAHESKITQYALNALRQIPEVQFLGNPKERGALISFTLKGIHSHDAAMILDEENIAVRSGHHCAQPVMDRFGVSATLRASFGVYTETWEIDRLITGLSRVIRLFR